MPSDASEDLRNGDKLEIASARRPTTKASRPVRTRRDAQVPAILLRAGENAAFAADEFFSAHISNPHTRRGLTA